jgi:hypothetical protein
MVLIRIRRPALTAAVLVALLVAALGGCLPRRSAPKPPEPQPIGPVEIDWADPGSVVEGFFDAKKRGDWEKAYSCCDFEEHLGPEEAEKIREEWKQEAPTWPEAYRNTQWYILDVEMRADYALVSVVRVSTIGPGVLDAERTGFDELCKRYGDCWKITEFDVMPK